MDRREYNARWRSRELRYPNWLPLPEGVSVHIHVEPEYAETFSGQVAAFTAASILSRMSLSVAVTVPSIPVIASLPWRGSKLDEAVMTVLAAAHPDGNYEQRLGRPDDRKIVIGPQGDGLVAHGFGWGAYCGASPSPFGGSSPDALNPFGAAFSVILAASLIQLYPESTKVTSRVVDTYSWKAGFPRTATEVRPKFKVGEIWSIGVGSVGSCALFFLSLVTDAFQAMLVDHDVVKAENVTRSAFFSYKDALREEPKVYVAERWLHEAGIRDVEAHVASLDELGDRWIDRQPGTPDILISAANERNVRPLIESGYPPLQVYGTTGRNWQATLLRHIPMEESCSLCVPRTEVPRLPLVCATGQAEPVANSPTSDDVALPCLSYAAGFMTAAEIAKLAASESIATPNRVFFEPRTENIVRAVALPLSPGCLCGRRDRLVHEQAIKESRFAELAGRRDRTIVGR